MNKKKAIKVITAGTIAASAFVAAAPVTTNAASVTPERATELIKAAYGAYSYTVTETGKFSDITAVYAAYNKAKDAYNSAVKTAKGAQLTALKAAKAEYLDKRVVTYIDAYNMGLKIKAATAKLDTAIKAEKLTDIVAAYTVKELGKSSLSILDRVYGKTTRELLRDMYTTPAGKAKEMVINEVTVATKIAEAAKAMAAGKKEDAAKALETAKMYLDKVNAKYKEELTKAYNEVASKDLSIMAEALNKTSVKVKFTSKVKSVTAANFNVTQKDVATNVAYVSKVELATDGMSATLTLATELTADKDYVVKAIGLTLDASTTPSATVEAGFFYAKSVPTSIVFNLTTVKKDGNLTDILSVKDQLGRDITKEVTLEVESSNNALIGDGKVGTDGNTLALGKIANKTGTAIVKVTIGGYSTITTGLVAITVSDSDAKTYSGFFTKASATQVPVVTYQAYTEADMKKSIKMDDNSRFLHVTFLDQYGKPMASVSGAPQGVEYRSLTPLVVIVNQDGSISPISAGTGLVEVTVNGVKAVVTIEVKEAAKLTSLSVSKESIKAGIDGVASTIEVKFKDQYGDTLAINKSDYALTTSFGSDDYATAAYTYDNGTATTSETATLTVTAKKAGSTTLKIKAGSVEKSLPVVISSLGSVSTYEIDPTSVTLDWKAGEDQTKHITVYSIDTNGNRIADVSDGVNNTAGPVIDPVVTLVAADDSATKDLYKTDGSGTVTTGTTVTTDTQNVKNTTVNINPNKTVYPAKTATFTVKVDSLVVGTVAVKVVDTRLSSKTATIKDVITLTANTNGVDIATLLANNVTVYDQNGNEATKPTLTFKYILRGKDYTNVTTNTGVNATRPTSPATFEAENETKYAEMNIVLSEIKSGDVNLLSTPVLVIIKRNAN